MRVVGMALAFVLTISPARSEARPSKAELEYTKQVVDAVWPWLRKEFSDSRIKKKDRRLLVSIVDITIDKKGKDVAIEFVESSGSKRFDRAVRWAIKEAKLPVPPRGLLSADQSVTVRRIRFSAEPYRERPRGFLGGPIWMVKAEIGGRDPLPPGDGKWRIATSEHFQGIGEASEEELRGVLQEFERVRALMRTSILENRDQADPTVPVTVYVMRTREQFEALAPEAFEKRTAALGGLYRRSQIGIDVFVLLEEIAESTHVIRHEYHHLYFDRTSPGAPLWMREGLAEVWAGAEVVDGEVSIGAVDRDRLEGLRKTGVMKLTELFEVKHDSPLYRDEKQVSRFYSQSFFLSHLLLFATEDSKKRFHAFEESIGAGTPRAEAIQAAWGDVEALQKRFLMYVNVGVFPGDRWALSEPIPVAAEVSVREIPESRAHAIRAWLLALSEDRDAAVVANAALKLDPDDSVAHEALGLIALTGESGDDAHVHFARAAAQPDARYSGLFLAAVTSPKWNAEAEAYLDRSLKAAPRFSRALVARAVHTKDKAGAVALAQKALEADPADPVIAIRVARVFRRAGKNEDAKRVAQRAVLQAVNLGSPSENAQICLSGALEGFAVRESCDQAVKSTPDEDHAREARAIFLTLSGSEADAAEDLRWLIENSKDSAKRRSFREWLDHLEKGRTTASQWKDYFRLVEDPLL